MANCEHYGKDEVTDCPYCGGCEDCCSCDEDDWNDDEDDDWDDEEDD